MARKPRMIALKPLARAKLDGESRVAGHRNLGQVAQHLFRERNALVEREQRRLLRVRGDRDDDPVEQSHATTDEILVAARDRVERAGIHGADFHVDCASLVDCARHCSAFEPQEPVLDGAGVALLHPLGRSDGRQPRAARPLDVDERVRRKPRRQHREQRIERRAYGGSRNTTSKRAAGGSRKNASASRRTICGATPSCRAVVCSAVDELRVLLDEPRLRRCRATAPRTPSTPVPAYRSRQRAPTSESCSQLNTVSRTRSGVGRTAVPSATSMRRPRHSPAMIRTRPCTCRALGFTM